MTVLPKKKAEAISEDGESSTSTHALPHTTSQANSQVLILIHKLTFVILQLLLFLCEHLCISFLCNFK